jgi:Arc/MetJ-type ribon-helix-helix transcriptional regulator
MTYLGEVSTQIAIRLDDDDLDALDREVREGRAASRSDALRRGIAHLRRRQRYRHDDEVLVQLVRRQEAVYPDLDGLLDVPRPSLD